MYELVYNSIADPRDIDEADLKGILAASRQHNQLRGITGFLLYHRGEFVQLLEGERDTVRQVYFDYIVRDPRHTNVNLCWIVKSGRAVFATGRWLSTGLSRRCTEKTPGLTGISTAGWRHWVCPVSRQPGASCCSISAHRSIRRNFPLRYRRPHPDAGLPAQSIAGVEILKTSGAACPAGIAAARR